MQGFKRTTGCGQVCESLLGQTITLAGWVQRRRDHGGLIFIDLRDRTGLMQLVFNPDFSKQTHTDAHSLRSEYVIAVEGLVVERSAATTNKELATGRWELQVKDLSILNRAKGLPFMLDDADNVEEELRLKYRYLDLRRPEMHKNFALRHKVVFAIREVLNSEGFYEIETPLLTKNTPEGSREFLVPSRIHHGNFYALPQSPQLYKQLLMASGMDKYFQIARCFRDEDLRADRQPEFTQIDMELAFIQQEDIMKTIEGLISHIFLRSLNVTIPTPFPRHTYRWCMTNYGSDKPDTRFDIKLIALTDIFLTTNIGLFQSVVSEQNGHIKAINMKGIGKLNDKDIDAIQMEARKSSPGVITLSITEDGKVKSSIAKHISESELRSLKERMDLQPGDLVVIASGIGEAVETTLGRLRLWARDRLIANGTLSIPQDRFDIFWVVDFPLFTWEDGKMLSTHHPFTAPVSEDASLLDSNPELVRGQHYDVVLNGYEIGGGSIRIHKKEDQIKVLRDVLKMAPEKVAEFQHLLDALGHGCPPHGGIALGFDRLMAVMVGAKSLRDVIAFPKSSSGAELMTGAPAGLGDAELGELFNLVKNAKDILSKSHSHSL